MGQQGPSGGPRRVGGSWRGSPWTDLIASWDPFGSAGGVGLATFPRRKGTLWEREETCSRLKGVLQQRQVYLEPLTVIVFRLRVFVGVGRVRVSR